MKKRMNLFIWMIVLATILTSLAGCGGKEAPAPAQTTAVSTTAATEAPVAMPEKKETITVRASVPVDWITDWTEGSMIGLWAWKDGGEDAFEAWPGEEPYEMMLIERWLQEG